MQAGTLSTSPATVSIRGNSNKTATRIDTKGFTLQHDLFSSVNNSDLGLKSIADYQNQLRIQGKQKQSLVVTQNNSIIATVGQNGMAMFQNSEVAHLWNEVDGNIEAFTSSLKKAGYNYKVYEHGTGPSYAQIHQQIHGELYETLIARQTIEFSKEMALSSGEQSLFSTYV
jgi:hypothetical protein